MKPGYSLELVQAQKLVLTPELRQAITILQMNTLELREYLRLETEKNPFLELLEGFEEGESETQDTREDLDALEGPEPTETMEVRLDQSTEEEWLAYFCDSSDLGIPAERRSSIRSEIPPFYQNIADKGIDLRDYLLSQLGLLDLSPAESQVGEFIIGNIDDNGYLRSNVFEIALGTGQPKRLVQKMIDIVQNLEPPGVGARDLRECLLIQASQRGMDGLVKDIIDRHLDDLASARYSKIAQEEKTSLKEVLKARDAILSLDPKPGAKFSSESVTYVIPDIIVKDTGADMVVILNDNALPRIRWNSFYTRLMVEGDENARNYLLAEFQKAKALFRNIERRKMTISRVMECILRRQKEFFKKGPRYLGPLSLKDVADEIGVHESTVSRAISNKHVDTPFGVFPCRMFFSPRVHSSAKDVSQYSVKKLLEDIIKNEDPKKPLSDGEVSKILSQKGLRVARRTVVKYRKELGIPSSNRRKKL